MKETWRESEKGSEKGDRERMRGKEEDTEDKNE